MSVLQNIYDVLENDNLKEFFSNQFVDLRLMTAQRNETDWDSDLFNVTLTEGIIITLNY
jgi:hypothetical protein